MKAPRHITRDIELSFDLSEYLITHPEIFEKFTSDNFVVFAEGRDATNKRSQSLLQDLLKKGETAIKAVRKKTKLNKWMFEAVSPAV